MPINHIKLLCVTCLPADVNLDMMKIGQIIWLYAIKVAVIVICRVKVEGGSEHPDKNMQETSTGNWHMVDRR